MESEPTPHFHLKPYSLRTECAFHVKLIHYKTELIGFCTCGVLAVKSISGEYFLRGHRHVHSAGLVTMGGAEFLYVRHESGMETLTAIGPLIEPIVVEVCGIL